MKNGTKSNRLFRLLNLEREGVADLPRWIVAAWSTPSSMKFARAVPGGCCRVILAHGKQSMATFGSGPRIGPGDLFTTRCETACARRKGERSHRPQLLLIANRSRQLIRQENAATTQLKRCRGANAMWPWTAWDSFWPL